MPHENEGAQHLGRETSNQDCRETSKLIRFDQLVEVDAKKLHCNAQMIAEIEMLVHLDDVVLVVRILKELM